jgi:hypothetical protein
VQLAKKFWVQLNTCQILGATKHLPKNFGITNFGQKFLDPIFLPKWQLGVCLVGEKWVKSYCSTFRFYLTNII